MRKLLLLACCSAWMAAGNSLANGDDQRRTLSGTIYASAPAGSATRAGLAGVSLRALRNQRLSLERCTLTDAKGFYHFDDLPDGKYRLVISKEGYQPLTTYFTVSESCGAPLEVALVPSGIRSVVSEDSR